MDSRLRVGCAVEKTEDEGARALMRVLKATHPDEPPPMATDAKGCYREALVDTWGSVPARTGRGRPPSRKQARTGWKYLQVQKIRSGSRLLEVRVKVIYGDPEATLALLGGHTAYIERTNLTSRQMNGRLVRRTLSFSRKVRYLRASCRWEDAVYNWTRQCSSLSLEGEGGIRMKRTPAMAAGLTDDCWTIRHLLSVVVAPLRSRQP
jgi:hypothetical protein